MYMSAVRKHERIRSVCIPNCPENCPICKIMVYFYMRSQGPRAFGTTGRKKRSDHKYRCLLSKCNTPFQTGGQQWR